MALMLRIGGLGLALLAGCTIQQPGDDDGGSGGANGSGSQASSVAQTAGPATTSAGSTATVGAGGDGGAATSTATTSASAGVGGSGGSFVPPSIVSIRVTGCLIGPGDAASGLEWDSNSSISPDTVNGLALALGLANPYAAALTFMTGVAADAWSPPDPYGSTTPFIDGSWRDDLLVPIGSFDFPYEDQFAINLGNDIGWDHVPVEPNMKLSLTLDDADDITFDDSIGTVELNYQDVLDAAEAASVFHVRTTDQGVGNILFVDLSVSIEL